MENEFFDYCNIGKSNDDIKRFKEWKEGIIKKHKNNNDILSLIKVFEIRKQRQENIKQVISVICLPLFFMLVPLTISVSTIIITKYEIVDSFQREADAAFQKAQEENYGRSLKSPQLQSRLNDLIAFISSINCFIFIIVVLVTAPSIISLLRFNKSLKKINYYTDYIMILNEIHDTRSKLNLLLGN